MDPARTLMVVDGTALLFRAYFGGAGGRDAEGVEVGAVRAVARRLARTLRSERPGHAAVVFDAGQRTFRNDLEPRYKANRGAPPPDLVPQFDRVQAAASALGLAVFSVKGFEADDLAATLARRGREEGLAVRLLSVDKDLAQLVVDDAPPVVQEDPWTGRVWDGAGVHERMGVHPHQVVCLQSLCGDSTDNIPGVKGVGPKTAAALLGALGSLDAIYADLDAVAGVKVRGARTLGAKLEAGRAAAFATRELVRLRDDVPLGVADLAAATRLEPGRTDPAVLGALGLADLARVRFS